MVNIALLSAAHVHTGGLRGFEITGSGGTLFERPDRGYVVSAPGQDPQPVPGGPERPTRVDHLVAAIRGELSRQELDADLYCAIEAVAVIDACHESGRTGSWVDVVQVSAPQVIPPSSCRRRT